jgi:hypothetical protein
VISPNPIFAVGPSAQPGISSSLKRTVIVLTFPFGCHSFVWFFFFFAILAFYYLEDI